MSTPTPSCVVCWDTDVVIHSIPFCNHTCCEVCLHSQIVANLNQHKLPTCPGGSNLPCAILLQTQLIMDIASDCKSKFEYVTKERSIPENQRIYCPHPDCGFPISTVDASKHSLLQGRVLPQMMCPKCDKLFCDVCKSPWHINITCDQYQQSQLYLAQAAPVDQRVCPNLNCGLQYHKYSGCDHITCPNCGLEFCFLCDTYYVDNQPNCECHVNLLDDEHEEEPPQIEPQQHAADDDELQFQLDDI